MSDDDRHKRFLEICAIEPRLLALAQKTSAIYDDPRSSDCFCANHVWYCEGLRSELIRLVGWGSGNDQLTSQSAYDIAYQEIYSRLPNCRNCGCM